MCTSLRMTYQRWHHKLLSQGDFKHTSYFFSVTGNLKKFFFKNTAQAHRHSVSHLSFVAYAVRLMGHTKGCESVRGIMWWAEFPPVAESFPFLVSKAYTSTLTHNWDNWFCEIGRGYMEMFVVLMWIIQTPFHATFYFYSTVHFTGKYSAPVSSNFYSMTVTWQL